MREPRGRAEAVVEESGTGSAHPRHVSRIAERIFDITAQLHLLGTREKELLVLAGLLHDIGWCGGQQKHHKRSYELIVATPPPGLTSREIAIVANVARYHRRALPSESHQGFAALDPNDREMVRKLAAILRVADGLDVSHSGCILVESCRIEPGKAVFRLLVIGDCDMEVAAAGKKSDLFAEVYGVSPRFEIRSA